MPSLTAVSVGSGLMVTVVGIDVLCCMYIIDTSSRRVSGSGTEMKDVVCHKMIDTFRTTGERNQWFTS